jgi:hypothetical protein
MHTFPSLRSLISGLFAGDFPANMTDLIKTPAVPICGSLHYFNLCSSESLIAQIVNAAALPDAHVILTAKFFRVFGHPPNQ